MVQMVKAPLFLKYKGVKVYYSLKDSNRQMFWYSTVETRPLQSDWIEGDFDVRELPPVGEASGQTLYIRTTDRPDHAVVIRAAIDAGTIKVA